MPSTEREKQKKESLETKKLIKSYKKEIEDTDKKIKQEEQKIAKLRNIKDEIKNNQLKLTKEKKEKLKKKEDYEKRIKQLESDISKLKEENLKDATKVANKDTTKLKELEKKIEDNIRLLEKDNDKIKDKIVERKEKKEQIKQIEKTQDELKNKLEKLKETVVTNDKNLIKEKELEIGQQRLENIDLVIKKEKEIGEILKLEFEASKNEQNVTEDKKQLIKANNEKYSNKKTKKELEIAELDVKLKKKICEICELRLQLNNLFIEVATEEKNILNSYFTISELEKRSIELKMKKDNLKHPKNKSMEESKTMLTTQDNVNQKRDKEGWLVSILKPITNLFWGSKQKITLSYYQNKKRKLEAEIRNLEAEKLKNFWNKFWIVISCGCYNNHGKVNRKIEKRNSEIEKLKKELEKLTKNNHLNSEPQPSTSSSTNQSEDWNISRINENESLPNLNRKKVSNNL